MSEKTYPLAKQGVFRTVQGEGALLGVPMVFVRLAGCSVGCDHCDTDYRVDSRATAAAIAGRVAALLGPNTEWVWLTGGEPLDHDLGPLLEALGRWRVAVATAGHKEMPRECRQRIDFLSVSPHDPAAWVVGYGHQLNLVPGLGGLSLRDPSLLDKLKAWEGNFAHRYVTPLADREGRPQDLDECLAFVRARKGWRLGCQVHKAWGVA